jgi:hypothetical protein
MALFTKPAKKYDTASAWRLKLKYILTKDDVKQNVRFQKISAFYLKHSFPHSYSTFTILAYSVTVRQFNTG